MAQEIGQPIAAIRARKEGRLARRPPFSYPPMRFRGNGARNRALCRDYGPIRGSPGATAMGYGFKIGNSSGNSGTGARRPPGSEVPVPARLQAGTPSILPTTCTPPGRNPHGQAASNFPGNLDAHPSSPKIHFPGHPGAAAGFACFLLFCCYDINAP